MDPLEVIKAKREHLQRLASTSGAAGEEAIVARMDSWIARPKGAGLRVLLAQLAESGVQIKGTGFDAIDLAGVDKLDFTDSGAVARALPDMVFIEIKTANQARVKPGFTGFFFALTENEIAAADQLGDRHRVALFNKLTGELMLTSVPEIVARSRSTTWQVSVQL